MSRDPLSGFCASKGTFCSKRQPVDLPQDPALSLPSFVFLRPGFDPSAVAYIDASTGRRLSYGQLHDHIHAVAEALWELVGVRHGDVILLLSPNSIPFATLMLGAMSIGAIATTCNPLNTPAEIAKQVHDCAAKFVAVTPSLIDKVAGIAAGLNLPVILLDDEPETSASIPSAATTANLRVFHFLELRRGILWTRHHYLEPQRRHHVQQDDTAALLYSSGTTGASKGVIITHRNLIAQALLLLYAPNDSPWNTRVYMCLIPMFHVYGLAFFGCGLLYRGCTVVLLPKFDMIKTLAAIQKYRVTHLPAVPPIIIALAKLPVVEKFDLSSLVQVGSGAAPLSKEVIVAFRARFSSVILVQGYGMTETTSVGAVTGSEEEAKHYGSVGLLAPNTEAKIVDVHSGKPLPPNSQGEIWIRGPTIMKGYFGRPGETAATIDSEGWLHTGDLGFIDSEGFLFVVDRLKELIKYKGLQVAPAELEALLLSNPKIVDAAVIPYPDDEAGQVPMAFIVKEPGSVLTEKDVIKFVAEHVAPYKKVRRVSFVSSIPKSAAGKILRRQLVNEAMSKL